jgi:D-3-phosphoglycerate dehydrogenase
MPATGHTVFFSQRFADDRMTAFLKERNINLVLADLPAGKSDADLDPKDIVAQLRGVDGWIVGHVRIDRTLLEKIPSVKVIARRGVGYEKIDLDAATQFGKVVTIGRGGNEDTVADHTLGLMLSIGRRIAESHDAMRAGRWSILSGTDLFQKTVGLVGFGPIAQKVAQRLKGFEARILVSTRTPNATLAQSHGVEFVELPELLTQSDYVSLHAPATSATRRMIDAAALGRMKRSAYLINTGRASLVDEHALVEVLKGGLLAGAGLDVLSAESDPSQRQLADALLAMPNVVVTPHAAASTNEALARTNMIAARTIVEVLEGRDPDAQCVVADGRASRKVMA